ncbi:hypothetical protein, partial [Treponema putidum]|uniref:hypothetical protein n=1 Tax=Treponema putidum TaxID=221027 RepID=UPI003D89C9C1
MKDTEIKLCLYNTATKSIRLDEKEVVLFNKYEKDPIYQQSISYLIRSKEVNRKGKVITYKITLDINSLFFSNFFYVTKEEYDLLKKGDEIPFIYNIQTKTKEFDE